MFRFILGVVVGAVAAIWLQRTQSQGMLDQRLSEMQDRANAVLIESRRVLEEVRRELSAALESGRRSVEMRTEWLRRGPEAGGAPQERPAPEQGHQESGQA